VSMPVILSLTHTGKYDRSQTAVLTHNALVALGNPVKERAADAIDHRGGMPSFQLPIPVPA
jgi:hypothetical protein